MIYKNIYTPFKKQDRLVNLEFLLQLQFEVNYGTPIRGGHSPLYFSERFRKCLVSEPFLLSPGELEELAQKFTLLPN